MSCDRSQPNRGQAAAELNELDWIKVYAEARVAFPADVWLRTEDDASGAVKITAYSDKFDPPLRIAYVVREQRRARRAAEMAARRWRGAKAVRQVMAFADAVARTFPKEQPR